MWGKVCFSFLPPFSSSTEHIPNIMPCLSPVRLTSMACSLRSLTGCFLVVASKGKKGKAFLHVLLPHLLMLNWDLRAPCSWKLSVRRWPSYSYSSLQVLGATPQPCSRQRGANTSHIIRICWSFTISPIALNPAHTLVEQAPSLNLLQTAYWVYHFC